jgi:thiol-disulfide isomerase/thioredoxin
MKRFFLIFTASLLLASFTGQGQNRSISFIEKPFSELLAMAKSQDKLVFMDAYTTWCGPCKWMAANMFTKDSIADYYNSTFICAHFDMEKGEGLELAKAYQVRAYPTLLFISASGEMVHKRVGAPQQVSDYLDMGRVALTPGAGFAAMDKRYREGDRDPKFISKYLESLQDAYQPVGEPLNQYLGTLSDADLLSRPNWNILYRYVSDMDSKGFAFLLSHQKEYAKRYSKDSVYNKIFDVYSQALNNASRSRSFSEASYDALKQKIRDSKFEGAEKVIFTGDLNILQMKGESEKFITMANTGVDRYFSDDYAMLNRFAWYYFQITKDKKNLELAAGWAKKSIGLKSTAENNDTYANLAFALGNKDEAVRYEEKALELAKKANLPTQEYEAALKKFRE